MTIKPSRTCFAAAFALSGAAFCAGAGAQSLTLSLKLDPVAPAAAPPETTVAVLDRCSGLSWAGALAASCRGVALSPPSAPAAVADAAVPGEPNAAEAQVDDNPGETFSGFGLPTLGPFSPARLMRAAREVPVQAGKAVDLLFRFASKYRLRNGDEGWEVVKFKDVTSENRTQASGLKGIAVELMLPFQ